MEMLWMAAAEAAKTTRSAGEILGILGIFTLTVVLTAGSMIFWKWKKIKRSMAQEQNSQETATKAASNQK